MKRRVRNVVMAAALVAAGSALAGHTGGYRGPDCAGVFEAYGLMKQWPDGGPKLLWKHYVEEGFAGPAVVRNRVYIAGGITQHLYVFSLDGKLIDKIPVGGASWKRYSGTRSTPLVHDKTVITSVPNGNLYATDLEARETRWQVNVWKSFGAGKGSMGWGYPATPMLHNDRVIFNPCSRHDETPPIVAIDINTGKQVWGADAGKGKKYSGSDVSGALIGHNGRDLVVYPTWRYLLCLEADTGKRLWEIATTGSKNLTPTYENPYLLWSPGRTCQMLKLSKDGSQYTVLWERPWGGGFSHAVILDGRVYCFSNPYGEVTRPRPEEGVTGSEEKPKEEAKTQKGYGFLCLDAETGKLIHQKPLGGGGFVIAAEGMVYAVSSHKEGCGNTIKVWLIKPTPDGFEVAGSFAPPLDSKDMGCAEIEWQASACPVIAEGRLFLRYGSLFAYDLRVDQPSQGWRADGTGRDPYDTPPVKWWRERNVTWSVTLPDTGNSAPVAVRDRVFVTCDNGELVCVDAATGKTRWRRESPYGELAVRAPRPSPPEGIGRASPTPVVRGDRLYALFGDGDIASYDLNGKRQWVGFAAFPPGKHGQTASPVLAGDVLVTQTSRLKGFDAVSGDMKWSLDAPVNARYGTPATARLADGTPVVVTGWGKLIHALNGNVLAGDLPDLEEASPVVVAGVAYFAGKAAGRNRTILAACRLPGRADIGDIKPLWIQEKRSGSAYPVGPLVADGLFYAFSGDQRLSVLEAATGKEVYTKQFVTEAERAAARQPVSLAHPAFVNGRIYLADDCVPARTRIVEAGPELKPVWDYAVVEGRNHPAFEGDRQFIRSGRRLYCVAGATPGKPEPLDALVVAPDTRLEPSGKQPLSKFAENVLLDNWLCSGAVEPSTLETDFLEKLGGRTNARPVEGSVVQYDEHRLCFFPLADRHKWREQRFTDDMLAIDVTAALDRKLHSTSYYYTVLESEKQRFVKLRVLTPNGLSWNGKWRFQAKVWLNGTEITEQDVVRLEKGLYPLMLQVRIGDCEGWGKIWMAPRFMDVSKKYAAQKKEYEELTAAWPQYETEAKKLFVLGQE